MTRRTFGPCQYCRREMTAPSDRANTAMTKDHVMPKCVGGVRKVRACRLCNSLKGDIHPQVWRWFQGAYPAWWKTFRTNREVVQACREHWAGMVSVQMIGRAPRWEFEGRMGQMPSAGE